MGNQTWNLTDGGMLRKKPFCWVSFTKKWTVRRDEAMFTSIIIDPGFVPWRVAKFLDPLDFCESSKMYPLVRRWEEREYVMSGDGEKETN